MIRRRPCPCSILESHPTFIRISLIKKHWWRRWRPVLGNPKLTREDLLVTSHTGWGFWKQKHNNKRLQRKKIEIGRALKTVNCLGPLAHTHAHPQGGALVLLFERGNPPSPLRSERLCWPRVTAKKSLYVLQVSFAYCWGFGNSREKNLGWNWKEGTSVNQGGFATSLSLREFSLICSFYRMKKLQ